MAYTDQTTGRNQRVAVMIGVALLQGAAIVAIVNGLTVHFTRPAPMPNPVGEQIRMPLDPPPLPPKPKDPPKPDDRQITRVKSPLDMATRPYDPPQPIPTPAGADLTPIPIPQPLPQPNPAAFTPRPAMPAGQPGQWVTTNDYPPRDLREGNQGTTGFRLAIGANGHVASCTVTKSSGFPGLDAATCSKLTSRARFTPATDGAGNPAPGEFTSQIRWVIPD